MSPSGGPPRLIALDDPAAGELRRVAVPAGGRPADPPDVVWIDSDDPAIALAELGWALAAGAAAVVVSDLQAARDYVTVHAALHGWAEVDPALALAPELRREPASG